MFKVPEKYRILEGPMASSPSDGNNGTFKIYLKSKKVNIGSMLYIIASDGLGWEHVSVSTPVRCPTWEEMCLVKDLFWSEDDLVIQYHPRKKDYVDQHRYCLHMWRSTDQEIPTPPNILV
jgi:hypothetical protein